MIHRLLVLIISILFSTSVFAQDDHEGYPDRRLRLNSSLKIITDPQGDFLAINLGGGLVTDTIRRSSIGIHYSHETFDAQQDDDSSLNFKKDYIGIYFREGFPITRKFNIGLIPQAGLLTSDKLDLEIFRVGLQANAEYYITKSFTALVNLGGINLSFENDEVTIAVDLLSNTSLGVCFYL
jgi:hypothetical protein